VRLLIQLGNDVRAERILLSRLVHRMPARVDEDRDAHHPNGALEAASLLAEDSSGSQRL
jgi:hypothetical protein